MLLEIGILAHVALDDLWGFPVPLELGDVERACHLAVPAADADVFVIVYDSCLGILGQGGNGADGYTGSLLAMHTGMFDVRPWLVLFLMELDDRAVIAGQIEGCVPERIRVKRGFLADEVAIVVVGPLACGHEIGRASCRERV